MQTLLTIPPAKFEAFQKVLTVLTDTNDPIFIRNSVITKLMSNSSIVSVNLQPVFESQDFNLHLNNPSKQVKLFKSLKGDNDIKIIHDAENSRYIVTNDEVKIFLPEFDESLDISVALPDLNNNISWIDQLHVDKSTRDIILNLTKGSEYIELLMQDNKVKALYVPDVGTMLFSQYVNDGNAKKLDESNAEKILRSTAFLCVPSEEYNVYVGQFNDNENKFLYTTCKISILDVVIYEELEESNIMAGGLF